MPLNIRDEIVDSVSVSLLQHVALLPRIAMPHTKTLRIKTAVATAGSECVSLPVVLSDWQLVEPLAMRTDTAIYAARPVADDGQHCQYCVKLVRPDAVHCEQAVALLRREAFLGRKVFHPHLISTLEANLEEPPYYLVMPLLEGRTLRQQLDQNRLPSISASLWFARQTAEALAALHACGWLHSDVKPSNIFIAADGHVTLLDLGLVRQLNETGSVVDRHIAGTFDYIAPEMFTSAVAADQRSDIYSLGATLYEMLSGQLPHSARTLGELASQHRQQKPRCIRSLRSDLPKAVARLLHRMLSKEPLRRPQSADEVVRSLVSLEIDLFCEQHQ